MPPNNFFDKVEQLVVGQGRATLLYINPTVEKMPLPIRRFDDPFLPFGKAVIGATRDLVCGYMFNFVDYLALGAAGAVALERTIAYAGSETITILHGSFSDINYVRLLDATAFNADAITVTNRIFDGLDAYLPSVQQLVSADGNSPANYNSKNSTIDVSLSPTRKARINIAGDDVLYADFGADFAEVLRNTVGEFNVRHHS